MQLFSFRPWDFVTESVLKKQKFLLGCSYSLFLYVFDFKRFRGLVATGGIEPPTLGL